MGQSFTIKFAIEHGLAKQSYYAKAYGGIDDDYAIQTESNGKWLNYTSSWTDFPSFSLDDQGQGNFILVARAKSSAKNGQYQLKIKITDHNKDKSTKSNVRILQVSTTQPTSTQTPIPEPTSNFSPTPTLSPSEKLKEKLFQKDDSQAQVLGSQDLVITPSPSPLTSQSTSNRLPVFFMVAGASLLLIPVLIGQFNEWKTNRKN